MSLWLTKVVSNFWVTKLLPNLLTAVWRLVMINLGGRGSIMIWLQGVVGFGCPPIASPAYGLLRWLLVGNSATVLAFGLIQPEFLRFSCQGIHCCFEMQSIQFLARNGGSVFQVCKKWSCSQVHAMFLDETRKHWPLNRFPLWCKTVAWSL